MSPSRHPFSLPMHASRGLAGAWLVVALGGCVSTPLPKLSTPLPAHWRNQPTQGTPARPPDLQSWWRRFDDHQLNTLVAQSLHANPRIAEATEHLRAAHSLATHSGAPFRPSVGFRTYHPVDPNANASFFVIGFDALWDLGLFGRRQGHQREALGHLESAAAELRLAQVNVIAEVVRDWVSLTAAQQRLAVLTRIRDANRRIVNAQTVRVRLGLAAPAELAQARAQAATAQADLATPNETINATAQHLALLLGRAEPADTWLKPQPLPRLHQQQFTRLPAQLLDTRPQIALARAKVLQAVGALGVAKANRYPDIGLGGSIIWSTSTLAHHGEPSNAIASFGPTINIPLLDWGLRKARATASGHTLKARVLAYKHAVLQGVARVEIALGNLAQERAREHANLDAWQALAHAANRLDRRQQLGLTSTMATAQSDIARDQALLAVIHARQARDTAYAALYEALGGAPDPRTLTARPATRPANAHTGHRS